MEFQFQGRSFIKSIIQCHYYLTDVSTQHQDRPVRVIKQLRTIGTITIRRQIHVLLTQRIDRIPSTQRSVIHPGTEVIRIQIQQFLAFLATEQETVIIRILIVIACNFCTKRIIVILLDYISILVYQRTDTPQLVSQGITDTFICEMHIANYRTVELATSVYNLIDHTAHIVVTVLSAAVAHAHLRPV